MSTEKNELVGPPDIPLVSQPPADCWLRVLVHGLFIGAFGEDPSGRKYLEVGAYEPGDKSHQLSMTLWNRRTREQEPAFKYEPGSVVELVVDGGDGIKRCDKPLGFPDRFALSWIADFETELYSGKCYKKTGLLKSRLRIYDGVVYTAIRSDQMEKKVDGSLRPWRPIAQLIVIGIESGKAVRLCIDGKELAYLHPGESDYNLVFRNDCGTDCDKVLIPKPDEPSDFNFLFKTFDPPIGDKRDIKIFIDHGFTTEQAQKRLSLELQDLGGSSEINEYLTGISEVFKLDAGGVKNGIQSGIPLSKYDPCGMGFFGGSNGLEDNPAT